MTHEFKAILKSYLKAKAHKTFVLATVVDVDGSSYRRPGVMMLISHDGKMVGAVSGGCVEKEVLRQAREVFETGNPKMMTYDGRYRLGCEGVLYILIEPFCPSESAINAVQECFTKRTSFVIDAYYAKRVGINKSMGSVISMYNQSYDLNTHPSNNSELLSFSQELKPCEQLIIVGIEHDAAQLCKLAAISGWEVTVVGGFKNSTDISDFPEAKEYIQADPEHFPVSIIDENTSIILMTHNFAKDVLYLQCLLDTLPAYIGLLGPARRREKILNAIIEYYPEVSEEFLDRIYGPSGLDIGAETPQEIAISILAELLAVTRHKKPIHLQHKKGAIHDDPKRKIIHA